MTPYDEWYYEEQYHGSRRSADALLPAVLSVLGRPVSTLADLGCGSGAWCDAAHSLGIGTVLGLDGAWAEPISRARRAWTFTQIDLRTTVFTPPQKFDLALCLEVAEHVPADAEPNIFASLDAAADAVLFSGAVPGQGGMDHINERPASHWRARMTERGYRQVPLVIPEACSWWYRNNTGLWVRP